MESRSDIEDPSALISGTLRAGVAVSFTLMRAGMVWTLLAPGAGSPTHSPAAGDSATGAIRPAVVLLLAGLLALMSTPVLRNIAAWRYFHRAGDRRFARISGAVLLIVAASILLALWHRGLGG